MKTWDKSILHLRIHLRSLVDEARLTRKLERHHLSKMNALRNIWPWNKKHKKGEPRPEKPDRPEFVARADAWGDKQHVDVLQITINEQYDKFWGLEHYRKIELRRKIRSHNLAYGFLRGNPYSKIEANGCYMMPNFDQVKELVDTYVTNDSTANATTEQKWEVWLEEALRALNPEASTDTIITPDASAAA